MTEPTTFRRDASDGHAKDWTPRQALMHALALLNDLPDVSRAVIVLASVDNDTGETQSHIVNCSMNGYETMGMLHDAIVMASQGD